MSKLIVEMEMPKGCPCELSAEVFDPSGNYGGHEPCFAWYGIPARSKEFDRCVVRSERPSWCPICGVLPEEHGDLIDRDKLKRAFCNHCDGDEPCSEPCVDIGLIETAPTVIAAERKDDEQIH